MISIIFTAVLIALLSADNYAFSCPKPSFSRKTALNANTDRRSFGTSIAAAFVTGVGTSVEQQPAYARGSSEKWEYENAKEVVVISNYTPRFDDLKQLYGLGRSLDKLNEKVSDPGQWDTALAGLKAFNKDANFYTGYAKNYISKIVKRSAADDARIGYIKEASALVGSCEGLLRGKEELTSSNAAKEASDRTKKAQALIAKFLAESGVEDERVEAFVAAH